MAQNNALRAVGASQGAITVPHFVDVLKRHGKTPTFEGRPWDGITPPVDPALYVELENRVFDGAHESLERLKEYAAYKRLNPVSLLVNVCAVVCASIPPNVVGYTGSGFSDLNLNLFAVNWGVTGGGKGKLVRAALEYTTVCINGQEREVRSFPAGTGEGIAGKALPGDDGKQSATLIRIDESSDLSKKVERLGATLRPTLLQVYSGEQLGAMNKDTKMEEIARENSYRMCLIMATQKDTAGFFFQGIEGTLNLEQNGGDGFMDRFIAVETINPAYVRPTSEIEPKPIKVSLEIGTGARVPVELPHDAVELMAANDEAKGYGLDDIGGSGHALETQAKLTVALALLRSSVDLKATWGDWERAGAIMDYSRTVFGRMKAHLVERDTAAKAMKRIADDKAREKATEERWNRIAAKILEPVKGGDTAQWSGRGGVSQTKWNSKTRDEAEHVFNDLVQNGTIRAWKTDQGATFYVSG